MSGAVRIGHKWVGEGHPVFVVAEIGINHNGSVDIAKRLIDAAVRAGCDAVKFQKRTPELCVAPGLKDRIRETPWGDLTYLEYRRRIEFGADEYLEIDAHCAERGINWFASCWDTESVAFIERFNPPCHKISSAMLTNEDVLTAVLDTGRPVVLSTGMSTLEQIGVALDLLRRDRVILTHCTSTYPCQPSELNLRAIATLREKFDVPVGYSGHEAGLVTTVAAATLGACLVERHITLDRSMWGSDQAASVEPGGLERLVRYIRVVEAALGTGVKEVYASELPVMERLRWAEESSVTPPR